jgi:hypothetical protein
MNVWGKDEEGRPVDKCRIIEMLQALDCNAASLIFYARELSYMHTRIISIIEALYKWDINDNSATSDSKLESAVSDSFDNATKARLRSKMNRDNVTAILKKFGWDIEDPNMLSPLEFHMATEN